MLLQRCVGGVTTHMFGAIWCSWGAHLLEVGERTPNGLLAMDAVHGRISTDALHMDALRRRIDGRIDAMGQLAAQGQYLSIQVNQL